MDCIVLDVTKCQTRLGDFYFHRTVVARNRMEKHEIEWGKKEIGNNWYKVSLMQDE